MADKLKILAKDTAIYGVSSIVGRFLNYLLVPLYTNAIAVSSGGYGVVTNVYAYTALFFVLLTFGMETTFFRFANKDGNNSDKVFSTALISVGFVAFSFALLCNIFIHPIASLMGYAAHPEYIGMMAVVVAIDAFQAILFSYLRFKHQALKFATLKLGFIAVNIALNLFVFLVAPGLKNSHPDLMAWFNIENQVGYIFALNLICTLAVTFGFIPELKKIKLGVDTALLRKMLAYAWPLLLLGLVGILNQVADKILYRFLVPGHEGDVQLGIYGACVKIAMIMSMLTQAFRYAYEPLVFGTKRNDQNKEMQAQAMKYFIIFTLLAFLTVVFYLDVLKYFINSSYWEGLKVIPIVMIAEIFMGIYFNLSFWYKLIDETWWGAVFSMIGCVVLVVINIVFVPRYGYIACAWGGLAGYGVCTILSFAVGQHKYPITYPYKDIAFYVAITAVMWLCSVWLADCAVWLKLSLRTLMLLVFAFVLLKRDLKLLPKKK